MVALSSLTGGGACKYSCNAYGVLHYANGNVDVNYCGTTIDCVGTFASGGTLPGVGSIPLSDNVFVTTFRDSCGVAWNKVYCVTNDGNICGLSSLTCLTCNFSDPNNRGPRVSVAVHDGCCRVLYNARTAGECCVQYNYFCYCSATCTLSQQIPLAAGCANFNNENQAATCRNEPIIMAYSGTPGYTWVIESQWNYGDRCTQVVRFSNDANGSLCSCDSFACYPFTTLINCGAERMTATFSRDQALVWTANGSNCCACTHIFKMCCADVVGFQCIARTNGEKFEIAPQCSLVSHTGNLISCNSSVRYWVQELPKCSKNLQPSRVGFYGVTQNNGGYDSYEVYMEGQIMPGARSPYTLIASRYDTTPCVGITTDMAIPSCFHGNIQVKDIDQKWAANSSYNGLNGLSANGTIKPAWFPEGRDCRHTVYTTYTTSTQQTKGNIANNGTVRRAYYMPQGCIPNSSGAYVCAVRDFVVLKNWQIDIGITSDGANGHCLHFSSYKMEEI